MMKARSKARSFKSKEDQYNKGGKDLKMLRNIEEIKSSLKFSP